MKNEKEGFGRTAAEHNVTDTELPGAETEKNAPENDAENIRESAGEGGGKYSPPFWTDLLTIVGVYVVTSVVVFLFSSLFTADKSSAVFISTIVIYPTVIAFAVWLLRKHGMTRPFLRLSVRRSDPAIILWGLLVLVAVSIVVEPLLNLFPAEYMDSSRQYILQGGGLTMLTVVVLAPVLEEMLFRGIIQESASRAYGPLAGIVMAAGIFAIVHFNPQLIINAFFCGIILGYIYYRTRSLIPVIVIHAMNNAIAYIMTRQFPEKAVFTVRQLVSSDLWYWIIYGVSLTLFAAALANLWLNLRRRDDFPLRNAK